MTMIKALNLQFSNWLFEKIKTINNRDSFISVELRIGEVSRKYNYREYLLTCSDAF